MHRLNHRQHARLRALISPRAGVVFIPLQYHERRRASLHAMQTDTNFRGSIPQIYDTHVVPIIFAPYAEEMASRVAAAAPGRVLEIAAGTGAVTRELAARLPETTTIVATDLNQPMLDHAASVGTKHPVTWRQADAMNLPFDAESFDAVVCQFAFMFFPDKPHAFAQAHRVLRPGGTLFFAVWDGIEDNELAEEVTNALTVLYPERPPRFLERTPHGYFDPERIARDIAAGGFTAKPRIETFVARSVAESAEIAALALVQGTPLRNELDESRLEEATAYAAEALARRFGPGPLDGKMQAKLIEVTR